MNVEPFNQIDIEMYDLEELPEELRPIKIAFEKWVISTEFESVPCDRETLVDLQHYVDNESGLDPAGKQQEYTLSLIVTNIKDGYDVNSFVSIARTYYETQTDLSEFKYVGVVKNESGQISERFIINDFLF